MQCQSKGVKVILSMGGAVGNYGFSSAADAIAYAYIISICHFICCARLMVIWSIGPHGNQQICRLHCRA